VTPLIGQIGGQVGGHAAAVVRRRPRPDDGHSPFHHGCEMAGAAQPQPDGHPTAALDRRTTPQGVKTGRPLVISGNNEPGTDLHRPALDSRQVEAGGAFR
jgi:hypothetical protein